MSVHRGRAAVLLLAVLALLAAEVLRPPPPAAAGRPPAEVVPAVAGAFAGFALPGTLAVVVARQHRSAEGLSVRAADVRAQRTAAAVAGNGSAATRPFPTASMVKLFMAEDLLHRARSGRLLLLPGDRALVERMITSSDDPAASALWVRYDGARMVRDVAVRYGLDGTAPPRVPGQWGRTTTTATDLARFLSLLPVLAHADDAALLQGWMRATTPEASDGFDQRFGLYGAAGGAAGVKQGWMCCVSGARHLHSVGVLGRTVVVLLSEVPREIGYRAVRDALTGAAAQVPPPKRS